MANKQNASKGEAPAEPGPAADNAASQTVQAPPKEGPANTDWEARFKALQKSHEATVAELKAEREKSGGVDSLRQVVTDIAGRLDGMESTNTLMQIHTLQNAEEVDKAQRLAQSAISSRLSKWGIEYNDPMLEGVRAVGDDPVRQFELFRAMEPVLRSVNQAKQPAPVPVQTTQTEAVQVDVAEIQQQVERDLMEKLNQHYTGGPTGPSNNIANMSPGEKIRLGIQQLEEQKTT